MLLNRRQFLSLAGVSMAWGMFPHAVSFSSGTPIYGRVMRPIAARAWADSQASTRDFLLPDSVHQVLKIKSDWAQISAGYLPMEAVQLMLPRNLAPIDALPAWAEVAGAYTVARRWCAPDAPIATRLDHADLVYVTRRLSDAAGMMWLQAEKGWIQESHLQPVTLPLGKEDDTRAILDSIRSEHDR